MQFIIKTLSKIETGVAKNSRGGNYNFVDINYKRLDNGKVEGKRVVDFSNKDVFNFAKQIQAEQEYQVTVDKDAKGYWQWVGIGLPGAVVEDNSSTKETTYTPRSASGPASKPSNSTPVRSTYETPEERAIRQRLIVAQSSVSNAIEMTKAGTDIDHILDTADTIFRYVIAKGSPDVAAPKGHPAFADMEDDIPQ